MPRRKKPQDWPRYMIDMPLAGGRVGYYWRVRPADRKSGCKIEGEPLGSDYGVAVKRANVLNQALDDWRAGKDGTLLLKDDGTLRWMFRTLRTDPDIQMRKNLSKRARAEYERVLRETEILPVRKPRPGVKVIGDIPLRHLDGGTVDAIYETVRTSRVKVVEEEGPTGVVRKTVVIPTVRNKLAEDLIAIARKAWRVVARRHPDRFPPDAKKDNPWKDVEKVKRRRLKKSAATREEAYALAYKLRETGHAHLGAGVLIAFE